MTLDEAGRLLQKAPGPSPWYLAGRPAVDSRWGALKWRKVDVNLALTDKKKHAYGLLGMYCFAIEIAPRTLLAWYAKEKTVTFHVVAVDSIAPLVSLTKTAKQMEKDERRWATENADGQATLTLRASNAGKISAKIPEPLGDVEEILFFVRSGGASLWVFQPKARRLQITPQDWFNKGQFDFDYVWPTRVAREPKTGRFVVDGIRMGVYVLDESGRAIAENVT